MKIEFDGAVSIEVPTDDELSEIYDTVKGTMQQEEALDLMREIKERTDRMAAAEGTPNALDEWNIVDIYPASCPVCQTRCKDAG